MNNEYAPKNMGEMNMWMNMFMAGISGQLGADVMKAHPTPSKFGAEMAALTDALLHEIAARAKVVDELSKAAASKPVVAVAQPGIVLPGHP